jgi:hypothetical protein
VAFFKKNPDPRPLGVPLDDLRTAINQTNLKASRDGNSLIVPNGQLVTRIDVVPPANRECSDATVRAVVQIRTEISKEFVDDELLSLLTKWINTKATLGALTVEKDHYSIGSRLTIYDQEDAWNLHFGLLLFTVLEVGQSVLRSILGIIDSLRGSTTVLTKEEPLSGPSAWTVKDFSLVESYLSKICVCTTSGLRLTSEFSLASGETTALQGDHQTALWQMFADQPHPELGGGLRCLLELPHRIADESQIGPILNQLNLMEMAPHDLPPHFGAWHPGNLGNNPAYVSFFPNVMPRVEGIALNASIWALHRAEWANAALASVGVQP